MNATLNAKTYRTVLEMQPIMDVCWHCKTEEIRVETQFGLVCFGCENILNALPVVELDMDDSDTLTYVAAERTWTVSVRVSAFSAPELSFAAQGEYGVTGHVYYTGPNAWEWGVTDAQGGGEGGLATPENPYIPRSLAYVLNRTSEKMDEWEDVATDGPDDYVDGWENYDGYDYMRADSDLMNEY